ncbi:hypothetical protein LNTAR_03759 [Lentisphaera araneosa HTCC2155]|uniref:EF-hand domain-containing protein n=1 Tax=Lentisphaera araneosa HTCC2155 TaxID=313628 RepID=A6DTN3_9BACT|nr:hypothetical protein [Lentisphaera araneosa]EDM25013.1 hypothetical protein LNTAR_03759 [Lentisphaera araneosa HTCC2155]
MDKAKLKNFGGSRQFVIECAEDIALLPELHEAFWMCTSAPCQHLNFPESIKTLLDRNKSGRIFSEDIIHFSKHILAHYDSLEAFDEKSDQLNFSHLKTDKQELVDCAEEVCKNLNLTDPKLIKLNDLENDKLLLSRGTRNGDGVIPAEDLEDKELRSTAELIVKTCENSQDVSGRDGFGQAALDSFHKQVVDYLNWIDEGEKHELSFKDHIDEIWELYTKLHDHIDHFFQARKALEYCESMDKGLSTSDIKSECFENSLKVDDELAILPLSPIKKFNSLRPGNPLNPLHQKTFQKFFKEYLNKILGRQVIELNEKIWEETKSALDSYSKWMGKRPQGEVSHLDEQTLRDYLDKEHYETLGQIIHEDLILGEKLRLRNQLKDLIILQQYFVDFCNNFVNYKYFYIPKKRAAFEAGTLILDGRVFDLSIPVSNVNEHSKVAKSSGMFCIYLKINKKNDNEPQYICAPVCALRNKVNTVGKRGILITLNGDHRDAQIVKIIDTPVSLVDSMVNPFRKISNLIVSSIEKISSSSEKNLEKQVNSSTSNIQKELNAPAAKNTSNASSSRDLIFTFAALGSSFTYIIAKLSSFNVSDVFNGVFNALLIILIPTFIISLVKLSKRNLSSIIEASGFALNHPLRLTKELSKAFAYRREINQDLFDQDKVQIIEHLNRKL